MKTKLVQLIPLHGYSDTVEVAALPCSLPSWPELYVVLTRPVRKSPNGEIETITNEWNVIHCESGKRLNSGCVSKTRKQAIADAETALARIAEKRGRDGVLRLIELETKLFPLKKV